VKIVLLSGGVGGAKLAAGLHDVLAPGELTVVGNVGDDLEVLGLHVSPDLDSVLYGLAGLNDTERGWGRAGETWQAFESARAWGGEGWFMLGDLDLGLHLVRSQALRGGEPLSAVTAGLTRAAGVATRLLPATDDRLRTFLVTPQGTFAFQEWFVARRHEDEVDALVYEGADTSRPAPGVLEAIAAADAIVIAPSNPFVSIHPILAVPGIRAAIEARRVRSVAVSPLIGGLAVRGPLDRMLRRLGGGTSPAHVTKCYKGVLDALVIDRADAPAEADVALVVTDTLIADREAARRLAQTTLEAAMEAPS
jgi:LPPG:FO 2-phospho-L-lactate transferase